MTRMRTHLQGLQLLGDLPLTSLLRIRRTAASSTGMLRRTHEIRGVPMQRYQPFC